MRSINSIISARPPRAIAVPSIAVIMIALMGTTSPRNRTTETHPVEAAFAATGPYATATGTVRDGAGKTIYDLFYPSDYSVLGFKSPIITWGNGTDGAPGMVSTLLDHFASYGFTVIGSTEPNTGTGVEIDAAAHYLAAQNGNTGSVFHGNLDVDKVAAVGHSQGAGGATRAAVNDASMIKTLIDFSLPDKIWISKLADAYDPAALTQPTFLIATHGVADLIIAGPLVETGYFKSLRNHGALGIIKNSDGKTADHNSIQDAAAGGNPGGFLGYATAWLEYQLRGDRTAARVFTGASPEMVANSNWPESMVK
jgi:pimeloyl-ACP methyl ester carboxylesterase